MSKKDAAPLHIEWTPGWVRAVNIVTGERVEGVTLKKLGQITIGHREVIVGVGRKIVFIKAVRLPKAPPEDLRRIIGVQLGQFFPLSPDQLSFDFIQTANQNQDGFLTIVGAIRAEDLRLLQTELKEVGLSARRVLPISLASSIVAAKAGEVDALVIERDKGDIALDVVLGSFLRFSRLTPTGSDLATESRRTLSAAGVGEIATIMTGDPVAGASPANNTLNLLDQAPPFNFELAESRVLHERQRIAVRTRWSILAVAVSVIVAALVFVQQQQALVQLQHAKGQSVALLKYWQTKESDESASAARLTALKDDLSYAFRPGQRLSDISAAASDSLPGGAWVTGLSIERAKELQVHGTAMNAADVAGFVDKLGSNARFSGVKLIFANSALIGTTPVIEFNVTADCVGNLPMPAPAKETGNVQTASTSTSNDSAGGG